eukprot:s1327_g7.t1
MSNLVTATYMQHHGVSQVFQNLVELAAATQRSVSGEVLGRWVDKSDDRVQFMNAYKLRGVGCMRPTNLGWPPGDIGLAMALAELEKSSAAGLGEVRQVEGECFNKASAAVVVAAGAHEEL